MATGAHWASGGEFTTGHSVANSMVINTLHRFRNILALTTKLRNPTITRYGIGLEKVSKITVDGDGEPSIILFPRWTCVTCWSFNIVSIVPLSSDSGTPTITPLNSVSVFVRLHATLILLINFNLRIASFWAKSTGKTNSPPPLKTLLQLWQGWLTRLAHRQKFLSQQNWARENIAAL